MENGSSFDWVDYWEVSQMLQFSSMFFNLLTFARLKMTSNIHKVHQNMSFGLHFNPETLNFHVLSRDISIWNTTKNSNTSNNWKIKTRKSWFPLYSAQYFYQLKCCVFFRNGWWSICIQVPYTFVLSRIMTGAIIRLQSQAFRTWPFLPTRWASGAKTCHNPLARI